MAGGQDFDVGFSSLLLIRILLKRTMQCWEGSKDYPTTPSAISMAARLLG